MSDTILSDCSSAAAGKISTQIDLLNYIYSKKRQRRVLSFLYLNKQRLHRGISLWSLSKYQGIQHHFYPCTPKLVRPFLFPCCLRYSGFISSPSIGVPLHFLYLCILCILHSEFVVLLK